jgi:homocysteine S-methyltransferase
MVLDGGLATTLEARGHDLNDELWSAKVLLEAPDAIRDVHLAFLAAGADCIATATYQASLPGLRSRGLSEAEALEVFRHAVSLAVEARDTFWSEPGNRRGRVRPLVAASIGPYGASLADGSEYVGRYGITDDELYAFHRNRWHVLAESQADLLACETIPSRREAAVLLRLVSETPSRWAWLSFSCRDERHLSDGSRLVDVAGACDPAPRVAAVGVNCTSPEFVSSLIRDARAGTGKPLIVYPNSGEKYDADRKVWADSPSVVDWVGTAAEWIRLGVTGVGGCCRVGPETIAQLRCQFGAYRAEVKRSIRATGVPLAGRMLDVGGGTSTLVDHCSRHRVHERIWFSARGSGS